jgi:molybdenum cofactor cytidylyltransferase
MTRDFFLIPGDYPLVKKETYEALSKSKADMAVPVHEGRKGHPVLIKKELIVKISDEPVESNLKVFRDRQYVEYIEVDDEGILMDVDTMDDLLKIRKKAEGR